MEENRKAALIEKATAHVKSILAEAILHGSSENALVIYDTRDGLTELMTEAYRRALPRATFVDFDTRSKEEILALFDSLSPRDLVVLIQSTDFRLNEFRIRIQLFQRKLKVIDHLHLYRNTEDSWETYIDALAYDREWYHTTGHGLKSILEKVRTLRIEAGDSVLTITEGLEVPKLNIGDYTGMENIGGTFPIGEVFTEAKDLSSVNGTLSVYAYAGSDYNTTMHEPFTVQIKDGIVVAWGSNTPESFPRIIEEIRKNERPIIREIGFGLNRAITREKYLKDITAFERMHGLHFSLGEKHTVYKKPGIVADKTRFHVDIFPLVDRVYADEQLIFDDGRYRV